MTKLCLSSVDALASSVEVPRYARSALSGGIVHIGVGNFHRAHMALYLHDLFNLGVDHNWAIIGAGVRAADAEMREALLAQDCLTTLLELDPAGEVAKITGAMVDFLPVDVDNASLIAAMCAPEIRIVSLTVTEGGYFINPASGRFDPEHPDIVHDARNPLSPRTAFGAIVAALNERRARGVDAFTVMSCDNLPENGHVARDTIVGLAQLSDTDLADWIDRTVAFPSAMVDRITPATSDAERELVRSRYGIDDKRPVTCEGFRQWVLEDNFPFGRPAFERVGVTMTDNVTPYETMKIRILNGGHAAMAYPAGLMGVEYVHEAAVDPLVRGFLDKVEVTEIVPIVPPVPSTSLSGYYAEVSRRLENPGVRDTVRRLCFDGSNRQPKFIIPSMRDHVARGNVPSGLLLSSALWCRYCAGTDEQGNAIAPNDPDWERLNAQALKARFDPRQWLEMRDIYGDLADDRAIVDRFSYWLNKLWDKGTAETLKLYIAA